MDRQGQQSTVLPSDEHLTFVPQINPISDELDNRMKLGLDNHYTTKERWQTLYELGLKKKGEKEMLMREREEMREAEVEACTFQPQIYSRGAEHEELTIDVVERNKMWAESRQKKLEMLKEVYTDHKVEEECTFQPNLKSNRNSMRQSSDTRNTNVMAVKSVERFVSRMH